MTRLLLRYAITLATCALVASIPAVTPAAGAQEYCAPGGPPNCTSPDCHCSSTGTTAGDPIDLAYGTTLLARTDAHVPGSVRSLDLIRYFTSDFSTWNNDDPIPPPFGFNTAVQTSLTLSWWHGFFSYLYEPPKDTSVVVRTMGGHRLEFECPTCNVNCGACPTPYWLQSGQPSDATRLRKEATDAGAYEYSLFDANNRRVVYANPALAVFDTGTAAAGSTVYMLGAVQEADGTQTVSVLYGQPLDSNGNAVDAGSGGGCPGAQADGGYPFYIAHVLNEDGTFLDFRYTMLPDATSHTNVACVLTDVYLGNANAAGETEPHLVAYTYPPDGGAGELAAATTLERTENYQFSSDSNDYATTFTVTTGDGSPVAAYTYSTNQVASVVSPTDGLSASWPGNTGCSDDPSCDCAVSGKNAGTLTSTTASPGNGEAAGDAGPGFSRAYEIIEEEGLIGPGRLSYTDSCDGSSCSQGMVSSFWWPWSPGMCGDAGFPAYPAFVQDKRGNYTLTPHVVPDAGSPPGDGGWQYELAGLQRGVTDFSLFDAGIPATCISDAGDCEWYGYTYGPNGEQLRSSVTRASVAEPGATVQELSNHDPTTNRLASTIRSGYTLNDAGTFVKQYRGTFYFTAQDGGAPDPENRTLETHGPCWVGSPDAGDCDPTAPYPITQTTYYPPDAGLNGNKLASVTKYTNGWGSLALTTTYSNYDIYGNALTVFDPNDAGTTYTYVGRQITSKTVDGATTTYAYDNDKLASIQYPEGNYEVFCYRTNPTGPGPCSGGTFTPLLQWRAKYDSGLTNWSEKVAYTYWPDGTVATESFVENEGGTPVTRRMRQYQNDAQRRPTWEGWGSDAGSPIYAATRSFDPADNLSGVGLPFNSPPAWCDNGTGPGSSNACSQLANDADNRLQTVTEFPDGGSPVATWFAYDTNGNVCAVAPGATSAPTCTPNLTDGNAYYQYDDFGNLVMASLPDTQASGTNEKGQYEYEQYDGFGNPAIEILPNGDGLSLDYDQLGRLVEVRRFEGTAIAFVLGYDVAPSAPAGCFVQNAMGRLATREDSFGTTYYSYDQEGHEVSEQGVRSGAPVSCSPPGPPSSGVNQDESPTTTYAYNANGDVTSIVYPHGREIDYVLGPDGGPLADRVSGVNVYLWNGSTWQVSNAMTNVTWEPYGGLRAYQVNGPSGTPSAGVEYRLGDSAAEPASCPVNTGDLGGNDLTGLLKAVWVSTGGVGGQGDILKVVYSWQADQVKTRDTCVLQTTSGAAPRRETFNPDDFAIDKGKPGYDQLLRVEHAEMPNRSANGGPYGVRDYGCQTASCTTLGYDSRGNQTPGVLWDVTDGGQATAMQEGYAGGYTPDELTTWSSAVVPLTYQTSYDSAGRASAVEQLPDSSGASAGVLITYGAASTGSVDTVGAANLYYGATTWSFGYYYDAFSRRRLKAYPMNGMTDEYFYDTGHQMLEDRGWDQEYEPEPDGGMLPGPVTYPEDDYVWLGGRPVAYVRGQFTTEADGGWSRTPDTTPSVCSRLGDQLPCGTYFVVTDQIGKPVVSLEPVGPSMEIAGLYDYDVYGAPNRQAAQFATGQYGSTPLCSGDGGTEVLGEISQPPANAGNGGTPLQVDMQVKFYTADTEADAGAGPYGEVPVDYAFIVDPDDGGSPLTGPIGGYATGPLITDWLSTARGNAQVLFTCNGENCCPLIVDGGYAGDDCTCSQYPQYTDGGTSWFPYDGVTVEAAGYREYQQGAAPLMLRLGFPGQYYDPETDLYENWHRFYDANTGRYLEPEPIWQKLPQEVVTRGRNAMSMPVYSYATDNPIAIMDSTGQYYAGPGSGCANVPSPQQCAAAAQSITDDCLRDCVVNQCNADFELECESQQQSVDCSTPQPGGHLASEAAVGTEANPAQRVIWCNRNLSQTCQVNAIVHELAHTCGWNPNDDPNVPSKGVPYGGGVGPVACQQ